ncbi:MAG: hypothetical protein HUJ26_08205 [Planctomycetaceae bacterium]|nr:hypothetical protein [Planctomycetaceae bacterium]
MAAGFERTIRHYQSDATTLVGSIESSAVVGCWFELHRQGGCGAGELRLQDGFLARNQIDIGDWISLEYSPDDRWYFGRVESRSADSPAGVRFRLEGMAIELNEVFPGGFGESAEGVPPHRYANTDLFQNDPDYLLETFDSVATTAQLVQALMNQYVISATNISLDPLDIEEAPDEAGLTSFKFRGEESVRSILKDLALRANNASWGVDETGAFFFLQPVTTVSTTYREGVHLSRLEESRDRDLLYNRVLLTGGYVYDEPVNSFNRARGFYRWRGHYLQPDSRALHGERRIRLWVPWIRTEPDSLAFIREFFRTYSQPVSIYFLEAPDQSTLLRPWDSVLRLLDRNGSELMTSQIETLRVQFDHTPTFRMELGPADPHTLWPEPPQDERWETPENHGNGGSVSLTPDPTSFNESSVSSLDSLTSMSSVLSLTSEETVTTLEPTTTFESTTTLEPTTTQQSTTSQEPSTTEVPGTTSSQSSDFGGGETVTSIGQSGTEVPSSATTTDNTTNDSVTSETSTAQTTAT